MESLPKHHLLQLPSGALANIRKIHSLDKPGRLVEAINILESWIQKQDHIIKKDFSREYLETTLIYCKGSVEKSKKQIDRLCTMKTLIPKFFAKTNLKLELKSILEIAWLVPLPILTKDYYRVFLVQLNDKKFTSESIMEFYQYCTIFAEYIKANDYANGFIGIIDYSKINILDIISKMSTEDFQQFLSILVDGYGARLKAIHILSDSKAIDMLIKIVKQLVSQKIGDRMHVHPTLKDLHKAVPAELFPIEYGGKQRSIHKLHEEWIEELSSEKHVKYVKMMNKACSDESRRVASKFNEEYTGMPGSFRNLSVD